MELWVPEVISDLSEGGDIMTALQAGQGKNYGSNPGLRKRFMLSRNVQTGQPSVQWLSGGYFPWE